MRESLNDIFLSLPTNDTSLLLGEWLAFQSAMDQGLVGLDINANQTGTVNLPDFTDFPFDPNAIFQSYERIFRELYALLGAELTWNATPYVESALDMLNSANISVVTPLLFLDGYLPMVSNNTRDDITHFL